MDALKILGSLLGNNATSSGIGGQFLDQMIGGLTRGGAQPGGSWGGGLGNVLGGMMGGGAQSGGLGGLLGGLMGSRGQAGGTGGLGGVLGSMMGGAPGGLGGLLGGMLGGNRPQSRGVNWGLLGGLALAAYQMMGKRGAAAAQSSLDGLEKMMAPGQAAAPAAVAEMQQQALVMIQAMINAAKADGRVDDQERENIMSKVADVGAKEIEFLQNELAKPLNLDFLGGIAREMAPDIYLVSLMAINLDSKEESDYMDKLAQTLGLDAQAVNAIHQQMGVAPLYS